MKYSSSLKVFFGVALIIFLVQESILAGQVVTDVERQWAQEALKNEKEALANNTNPESNTLAVLYLHNKSGQPQWNVLQKGLTLMLITDLSKVDKFQVVERIRLQALLDEMELGASGLVVPQDVTRMGNLLGVSYVAGGDIFKGKATELVIDPSILDVPDEMMLNQPYAYGNVAELIVVEKKLLFDIIRAMEIELTPDEKHELEKPLSISSGALLALFTAIHHSDRREYAKAAEEYSRALHQDPDLTLAREALQELHELGLISAESAALKSGQSHSPEPQQDIPPTSSGGASIGKVLGVGIGLAAIGGGVALAVGGSGSDDEEDSSNPPPDNDPDTPPEPDDPEPDPDTPPDAPSDPTPDDNDPPPDTTPTVIEAIPAPESDLACDSGQIIFDFSEAMDASAGSQVRFLDSRYTYSISIDWGRGDTRAVVSYSNTEDNCDSAGVWREDDIRVELNGFRDPGGNSLSGSTIFNYTILYRILL